MNTIREVNVYSATSLLSRPIADATHEISEIKFYIMEVITNRGVVGQGYLLAFNYSPGGIEGALRDIKEFAEGGRYDVSQTVRLKQDYEREAEYFGNSGLQRWAAAVLNVAMWDAWGKTLGQPVWKLLGSGPDKVPVYGSGGWLSYSDEELLAEVKDYKKRGFTAVKIKVGSKDIERDVERLKKCREALGESVKIMIDANQGLDVPTALRLAEAAKTIGIHWFEEPIVNTDYAGYELLRHKCGIAMAMGEREYSTEALKHLISRNALDLWQPDLIRLGGVEEWRSSAAVAQAYNIPVLPHYYTDYDVPLLCTIPNGRGAEYFAWVEDLIDSKMVIENGFAY
ncbi:MAG: mandelate racemase/muconate lactonizing enzyme family protein, partial [Limnochordia bacterium]